MILFVIFFDSSFIYSFIIPSIYIHLFLVFRHMVFPHPIFSPH